MTNSHITFTIPNSDIVEAGYLESMLDNFSSSYKLFWFKGILKEMLNNNRQLEYKRVVARMIAAAWYPVVFYNLSLGISDKLADAIWYIHNELGISREEQEDKIVSFVYESIDTKLLKMIQNLTNMVPYRLIRPFYQPEIDQVKKTDCSFTDHKVNGLIEMFNRRDGEDAFYKLDSKNKVLTISEKWFIYIKLNVSVIEGWLNFKLIEYIQQRNPCVPAIPFKIFPPVQRNLSEATKYWCIVQEKLNLPDLYTEQDFSDKNFEKYGPISIDHFVPWSFVLHDEIWNLIPVFKNINSMKGNKLPDKGRYLDAFCESQYQAFIATKSMVKLKKTTEQYLTVSKDIYSVTDSDRGHDHFIQSMRHTIEPLYQIANNQGYGIWWYT